MYSQSDVDDELKIGGLATIKVKEIKQGQVRFGIDAPRSVAVHRLEIYQNIQDEGIKKLQLK